MKVTETAERRKFEASLRAGRAARARPHMEWLLRFLRVDLDRLTPGQLIDLHFEVLAIHGVRNPVSDHSPRVTSGISRKTPTGWKEVKTLQDALRGLGLSRTVEGVFLHDPVLDSEGLRTLQTGAVAAIEALEKEGQWEVPGQWSRCVVEYDKETGLIAKRYDSDIPTVFFATVADLLLEFWPSVRRCASPDCRALFLPSDPRQTYCSKTCSERVRQERHRPKRQRDYQAEHRRRVEKKHPGAKVKVGRKR
jgi:hypothetical protein